MTKQELKDIFVKVISTDKTDGRETIIKDSISIYDLLFDRDSNFSDFYTQTYLEYFKENVSCGEEYEEKDILKDIEDARKFYHIDIKSVDDILLSVSTDYDKLSIINLSLVDKDYIVDEINEMFIVYGCSSTSKGIKQLYSIEKI